MTRFIVTIILLTLVSTAQAEFYMEVGIESGGGAIVVPNPGGINAGSGFKLALGTQNVVGENGERLTIALGYMFADSGDGVLFSEVSSYDFSTMTLDAIYTIGNDPHRFGIGGTYHIGPSYSDNVLPSTLDFDDALGLILQYTYTHNDGLQIGARLTSMDYEVSGSSVDASSFGIFLSF